MVKTEAENKQIKRKKNIINNQSCLGPFLWNSGTVHCFSGNFLSCPKSLHWGCISSLSLVHPSQRESQPSPSLLGPSLQHSHPIGTLTAGKSSICFSFRERTRNTRHTFLGQTNFGIAKSGIYSASFRQEWKNFSPYCLQAFLKDVSRRILLLPIGFRGCLSVFYAKLHFYYLRVCCLTHSGIEKHNLIACRSGGGVVSPHSSLRELKKLHDVAPQSVTRIVRYGYEILRLG